MRESDVSPVQEAPRRDIYAAPKLARLGSAAALTETVSMKGLMDGFMGRRTG